jgi:RsiW-degrading membrane proteinase PrsW (M82 family)
MGPELLRTGFERGLSVFTQVIVRGVFDIFGHQAYAGICAYYVGLAALRPKYKASLIIRGYIIAALLHAAYDATGGFFFQFILTAIPFVLLVTVILQGRKISPTRMQNFATLFGQKA